MYELGGRRSLQIGLNILGEPCGGCQYESYPYKAQLPIRVDGKYPRDPSRAIAYKKNWKGWSDFLGKNE